DMFNLLKEKYSGFTRERVIVNYLLKSHSGVNNNDYKWCLEQALMLVKTKEYKSYLKQQLSVIKAGAEAYDFILPSEDNIPISLSGLKGKVVLIDFWFTGCAACKVLAKVLEEEVIPMYNSTAVAFISIGLDKDKSQWLKSLKGGG